MALRDALSLDDRMLELWLDQAERIAKEMKE
ncbi:hypothetical protein M529_14400 [Sphingobium ummariense RL-3]|uniref:Uncharacterized protein n=1 Tax=Sphingobium ummariense RL-3 TaxID=1346791 RepID=T0IRM6_9SPHN|nr:hypothetical protein M529_14400 [Sphingobium ummariense RL-3]